MSKKNRPASYHHSRAKVGQRTNAAERAEVRASRSDSDQIILIAQRMNQGKDSGESCRELARLLARTKAGNRKVKNA